jgi:hypothetical protein
MINTDRTRVAQTDTMINNTMMMMVRSAQPRGAPQDPDSVHQNHWNQAHRAKYRQTNKRERGNLRGRSHDLYLQ